MAAQKFKLLLLLITVSSCAFADDPKDMKIDNYLSSCVAIEQVKLVDGAITPTVSFDLKVNKVIAECGCRSAIASYQVDAVRKNSRDVEYKSHLTSGAISFKTSSTKYLSLASEKDFIDGEKLLIHFSCSEDD